MTFSDDALQLTGALKLMPDPLNVSCLIISSFWCFSAAAYKAGKIATNPFQGGNAPGAGAMVPPPASMGGREYWLQVLLLVSLLFGVGHAPTSNSDFVLITSVLVLEFLFVLFFSEIKQREKNMSCCCPCFVQLWLYPLSLLPSKPLVPLKSLFSQFTCSHWLWIYISSLQWQTVLAG